MARLGEAIWNPSPRHHCIARGLQALDDRSFYDITLGHVPGHGVAEAAIGLLGNGHRLHVVPAPEDTLDDPFADWRKPLVDTVDIK